VTNGAGLLNKGRRGKMKKQFAILIMIIGIVAGCSTTSKTFDDENIIFKVVDTQSNNELKLETIKITNETGFDLDNLSLKISYPLDTINTKNSAERETVEIIDEFKMKSSETKDFSIPLTLNENIGAIDLEVDFKGNVVEGNKKVPFEIGGTLSALVEKH